MNYKRHVKRIRFVGGKVMDVNAAVRLARELHAMGYLGAQVKSAKNNYFADVVWSAPENVSFRALLAKYEGKEYGK